MGVDDRIDFWMCSKNLSVNWEFAVHLAVANKDATGAVDQ
jgi:hypothetical protein